MEFQHKELTKGIIGAFYDVYNSLGYGFLEKVYENALTIELRHRGFQVEQQYSIQVLYRGEVVGDYFADLVVNDLVILELKATKDLAARHEAQLLNYLKATRFEVGLLLNFGPTPTHTRKAYQNSRKANLKK